MKLLIAADIHGNYDAWGAVPEDYDELWVLGDLVDYGPQPREVVAGVIAKASLAVQGNHDNAVAYDDDSRWSSRYRSSLFPPPDQDSSDCSQIVDLVAQDGRNCARITFHEQGAPDCKTGFVDQGWDGTVVRQAASGSCTWRVWPAFLAGP